MLYFACTTLQQSRFFPKKEEKIKTVIEILLCHFIVKSSAKVIIKFKNQILCPSFFVFFKFDSIL
jgi:hypothetical protein